MAAPLILARTFTEAHEFARDELGLPAGHYQVVSSPAALKGRHGVDLYLVPGYKNRYDRFAMQGALRYTRLNVIDVEAQAEEPVGDGLIPPGTQPELVEGADPALVAEFEAFLNGTGEHPHEQDEEPAEHEFVTAGVAEEETAGTPASAAGDPVDDAHGATDEQAEEPVAEPETKRRRRRCKECGVLVEPDEVESHAAEHLPVED